MADAKISELPSSSAPSFSDLLAVVNSSTTKQLSVQQLASMMGMIQYPTSTLTNADVGKLIVNKAGLGVVATRDTARSSQAGDWTVTVTGYPNLPTGTTIRFTLSGLPTAGDYLRLGLYYFEFVTAGSGKNQIPIAVDVDTQLSVIQSVLSQYPDMWGVSIDTGGDYFDVFFQPEYDRHLEGRNAESGVFFPQVDTYGSVVDASSLNISSSVISGDGTDSILSNINGPILNGYIDVDLWGVLNNAPSGTLAWGVRWPTDNNSFAAYIEDYLNAEYSTDVTVMRTGNVLTITALNQPNGPDEVDLVVGQFNWFTITTNALNISSNADMCMDPILGRLEEVVDGEAIINPGPIFKAKISGTYSTDVTVLPENLETYFNSYVLIPGVDGTLETLKSFSFAESPVFDSYMILATYKNVFTALESGDPDDEILVVRGIDISLLIGLIGVK